MTIHAEQTLADIVLDHADCAPVLARHRIDYCCHGDLTLADACARRGIGVRRVLADLEAVAALPDDDRLRDVDPRRLPTRALVAHIVERHHRWLRQTLPFVTVLADKVAQVHGMREPRLRPLALAVRDLADTLDAHLDEEERVLFPSLLAGRDVLREIEGTRTDHEEIGELLGQVRALAADFTVPAWGCSTYRTLMAKLAEVERDTFAHVHLENHVLLPRPHRRARAG